MNTENEETKKVKGIECKFIVHRPSSYDPIGDKWTDDIHWVKERIHYEDGTYKNNFRTIRNYKRPYWVTLEHFRNHKQKKESEFLDKVKGYTSTQSELWSDIARTLGKIGNQANPRFLKQNPYLYGTDIDSRVFLRKWYKDKYPECFTDYSVACLDIENDIDTDEITIISIAREWETYTAILRKFLKDIKEPVKQLNKIFKDNIPLDTEVKTTYEIFDTELECFEAVMKKAHEWEPDFLAIWNMEHELKYFSNLCESYGVKIEDYFSDPSIPKEFRFFKYVKKAEVKVSASGVSKASDVKDRWNTVYCPSKFYVVDAMCAYNYVRAGGKKVPGGYGLDNILEYELGSKFKKLKFSNLNDSNLYGADWHRYMVNHRPLEYIVYNQWDVLSMLVLDNKTKDLKVSMPTLLGVSTIDVFDSGPKRVVNSLMFKALSLGKVLGNRQNEEEIPKKLREHLGLNDWIITLPSSRLAEFSSISVIEEDPTMKTTFNTMVSDADQESGYPSGTMELNVSRNTTLRELLEVQGIPKEVFKKENINVTFGPVSHLQYTQTLMNFPTIAEMDKFFKEHMKLKKKGKELEKMGIK